jgi:hypothetical protein
MSLERKHTNKLPVIYYKHEKMKIEKVTYCCCETVSHLLSSHPVSVLRRRERERDGRRE